MIGGVLTREPCCNAGNGTDGGGRTRTVRQTRTKSHQPNTFLPNNDNNSDHNDNNQPTATIPTRTAVAAASMTRTCIFVLVRTATRYECSLTRWNAASRAAPDQNPRCIVHVSEAGIRPGLRSQKIWPMPSERARRINQPQSFADTAKGKAGRPNQE